MQEYSTYGHGNPLQGDDIYDEIKGSETANHLVGVRAVGQTVNVLGREYRKSKSLWWEHA